MLQPCSDPANMFSADPPKPALKSKVMTKHKRERAGNYKSASKQKGELVERIVAMMHEQEPQVTVLRDVRLPAKHSGKRSRQIDVLLLGHFAGYPSAHAIECKNYG